MVSKIWNRDELGSSPKIPDLATQRALNAVESPITAIHRRDLRSKTA
jgi:hypothetical protein